MQMKKPEILILSISIGLTALLSTLFGLAGSAIVGTFWGWFWISVLVLFVGFAVINSYFLRKDAQISEALELEALREISKITVRLSCAYCQQFNSTQITVNQRNMFKCESCNQVNGVSMQFMATTLTSPIESVKMPIENSGTVEFKVTP
jgi:hypothetical protein